MSIIPSASPNDTSAARDELREYADRYGYTEHVNGLLDAYRDEVLREAATRPRQVTPMQLLADDVETAIAPMTGEAKKGAEMVLRYIRTLAAPATIPFTTEATS